MPYLKKYLNKLVGKTDHNNIIYYPTPKNLSYNWSLGFLSGFCLIIQILTGFFLSLYYIPEIDFAFLSVEYITRDVNLGWLMRYLHANGASMFFFVIFFHIFRNFYFGSYVMPRSSLWYSGIVIFFLVMATTFIGYVLPCGQISLGGFTVSTNLFSAVPEYGPAIVEWLWGGFSVDQATLNIFYRLHFFLPFVICGFAFAHLVLLHESGSSDPLGLDFRIKYRRPATITFSPYSFVKDLFFFFLRLFIFCFFVFNPQLSGMLIIIFLRILW